MLINEFDLECFEEFSNQDIKKENEYYWLLNRDKYKKLNVGLVTTILYKLKWSKIKSYDEDKEKISISPVFKIIF
jgi:hypothetical protein